ncbi:hypothetical protein PF004_g27656 [Phytophthora fragariae]|uniref:Uncharacterized protein n=1 Tax=Phytophthora fragariae TaxID=53985 RepID=A0A6G0MK71_9STRA|nr:hypothetical protein PF004_g27656 [Phytophthora fragariae]
MDNAAGKNYLAAVKWLHDNRKEGCSPAAMVNAASKGYLDVVKYLYTEVDQLATDAAIYAAAKNGHVQVVEYLVANRCKDCKVETTGSIQAESDDHAMVAECPRSHGDWQEVCKEECKKDHKF